MFWRGMYLGIVLAMVLFGVGGRAACGGTAKEKVTLQEGTTSGRLADTFCVAAHAGCGEEDLNLDLAVLEMKSKTAVVFCETSNGSCAMNMTVTEVPAPPSQYVSMVIALVIPVAFVTTIFCMALCCTPPSLLLVPSPGSRTASLLQYIVSPNVVNRDGESRTMLGFFLTEHFATALGYTVFCLPCALCNCTKRHGLAQQACAHSVLVAYSIVVIGIAANWVFLFFAQPVRRIKCTANGGIEIAVGEDDEVVDLSSSDLGPLAIVLDIMGLNIAQFLGIGVVISLVGGLLIYPARAMVERREQWLSVVVGSGGGGKLSCMQSLCFLTGHPFAILGLSAALLFLLFVGTLIQDGTPEDVERILALAFSFVAADVIFSAVEILVVYFVSARAISNNTIRVVVHGDPDFEAERSKSNFCGSKEEQKTPLALPPNTTNNPMRRIQ